MNNNQQPNHYEDYDEIDLREIFKTLGKWKWTIIGITIGAMLLASDRKKQKINHTEP